MGMAGSGKTTLLQRLNLYTTEMGIKSYFVNLDPAVKQVPFGASIDIRDTVNYKEVRAFKFKKLNLLCTRVCKGYIASYTESNRSIPKITRRRRGTKNRSLWCC